MKDKRTYNEEPSADPIMFEVLIRFMEYGDVSSVARALGWAQQKVDLIKSGRRRGPFEAVAIWIEQLRRNGNEHADELFLVLARRLGFVAYRIVASVSAASRRFATVMTEVGDVAKAYGELTDEQKTAGERRSYVRQLDELIEAAVAERDEQKRICETEESNVRRMRA